jgi:O-antigen/teichoic acid export membrane protein
MINDMSKKYSSRTLYNLAASYAGQIWVALLSVIFIPVYVKFLGWESYGIIGFYAFLQASLVILDLGLRSALSRETVRYFSGQNQEKYRDLVRSIELIFLFFALILVVGISATADWFSTRWFILKDLTPSVVASCLRIMGFIVAFRFMEGIYSSILLGQQRHVLLNIILSLSATLKGVGAVFILVFVAADLESFFLWQALLSLLSLVAMMFFAFVAIGPSSRNAKFSLSELKRIKSYALSIAAASILGVIIANSDKLLLSTLIPLSEFGVYALAVTIASFILTLAGPINQTWLPKLTELVVEKKIFQLNRTFHIGAQISSLVIGTLAIVLIIYANTLLLLWTDDEELSAKIVPILRVLVVGNLFSAITRFISQTAYAHGLTRLVLYFNIFAMVFIIPGLYVIIPHFGAIGAAYLWALYTGGALFLGCPLFFRNILIGESFRWYILDTALPLAVGILASLFFYFIVPQPTNWITQLGVIILGAIITFVTILLSMPLLRGVILMRVKKLIT